jgi:hypothetical protein
MTDGQCCAGASLLLRALVEYPTGQVEFVVHRFERDPNSLTDFDLGRIEGIDCAAWFAHEIADHSQVRILD